MALSAKSDDVAVPDTDPLGPIGSKTGYILHRTDVLLLQHLQDLLDDIGLTPARATAIALVVNSPGIGQTDLARVLGIKRAAATQMIDWLENIGALERVEGSDRRSKDLMPTQRGRDLCARFENAAETVDGMIADCLEEEERAEFDRLLAKVARTARERPADD